MRRIAIVNQKGGVGKTTTAANLGAALARRGRKVVLVDLDPQGNLSTHLDVEVEDGGASSYGVLCDGEPFGEALRPTSTAGLFVVPADIDLSGAEMELAAAIGRESILRDSIDAWEEAAPEPFDYIIFDCPPSLGLLSVNGLVAAREVFITLQTEFFALKGMSKLVEIVQLLKRRLNPELEISGIIPCLYDSRLRLAREVLAEIRRYFPGPVFRRSIRTNVKLAEAPSFGMSIFDYAPESAGASDYLELADEVLAQELGAPVEATETTEPPASTEVAAEQTHESPAPSTAEGSAAEGTVQPAASTAPLAPSADQVAKSHEPAPEVHVTEAEAAESTQQVDQPSAPSEPQAPASVAPSAEEPSASEAATSEPLEPAAAASAAPVLVEPVAEQPAAAEVVATESASVEPLTVAPDESAPRDQPGLTEPTAKEEDSPLPTAELPVQAPDEAAGEAKVAREAEAFEQVDDPLPVVELQVQAPVQPEPSPRTDHEAQEHPAPATHSDQPDQPDLSRREGSHADAAPGSTGTGELEAPAPDALEQPRPTTGEAEPPRAAGEAPPPGAPRGGPGPPRRPPHARRAPNLERLPRAEDLPPLPEEAFRTFES
ncbi:MAG: AAA family ATPase [Planctomycetota bacterium]|nr:AAA family ATPase [Planctomycetota bacterium]